MNLSRDSRVLDIFYNIELHIVEYLTHSRYLTHVQGNFKIKGENYKLIISVLLETRLKNSRSWTYSGISVGSGYAGKGGTGGDGDASGTGSIEPGGNVKLSLFFDIW